MDGTSCWLRKFAMTTHYWKCLGRLGWRLKNWLWKQIISRISHHKRKSEQKWRNTQHVSENSRRMVQFNPQAVRINYIECLFQKETSTISNVCLKDATLELCDLPRYSITNLFFLQFSWIMRDLPLFLDWRILTVLFEWFKIRWIGQLSRLLQGGLEVHSILRHWCSFFDSLFFEAFLLGGGILSFALFINLLMIICLGFRFLEEKEEHSSSAFFIFHDYSVSDGIWSALAC